MKRRWHKVYCEGEMQIVGQLYGWDWDHAVMPRGGSASWLRYGQIDSVMPDRDSYHTMQASYFKYVWNE